ncbi:hypothetical protein F4802DRAFT_116806 [Xylaria palmicola]|nr:hypothetical protein F4802DRAFT_116806 [Xylaria palmicola]
MHTIYLGRYILLYLGLLLYLPARSCVIPGFIPTAFPQSTEHRAIRRSGLRYRTAQSLTVSQLTNTASTRRSGKARAGGRLTAMRVSLLSRLDIYLGHLPAGNKERAPVRRGSIQPPLLHLLR